MIENPVTDLPEPDSPTNPMTSPLPTVNETPSTAFADTAARARYLLGLFAGTQEAQHPRRQILIDQVRADLQRICDETELKP